jgi:hypothetical protein
MANPPTNTSPQGEALARGERHKLRETVPPGLSAPSGGGNTASTSAPSQPSANAAAPAKPSLPQTDDPTNTNALSGPSNIAGLGEHHGHHDREKAAAPGEAPAASRSAPTGEAMSEGFRPRGGERVGPPKAVVPTAMPPGTPSPFQQNPPKATNATPDNASTNNPSPPDAEDKHHKHRKPDEAAPPNGAPQE